jgi:UDP-sulfoquinovose synthase
MEKKIMKIIVFGGDGFCGWPTSLKLAGAGHDVTIVDNLSRRNIDKELKSNSLTDITDPLTRVEVANHLIGNIRFVKMDIVKEYEDLVKLISSTKPDAVVHFAEQRAAPYSMIGSKERRYTIDNNISGTHNICSAIVESGLDVHLVHLGTMGVYGYSHKLGSIPEGYLSVNINETKEDVDILYPANPGSVYHLTKTMDQLVFQYYHKNWGLRVTDLHQGIVWGVQTDETKLDEALVNRFDYDGVYGTVLNRFISQAAAGYPLTVYGTGGQKRAFIHIKDTTNCIKLTIENAPSSFERVRIFNQVAETRNLLELANIIHNKYGAEISYVENPRNEAAENELEVHNEGLISLGFKPIFLNDMLIDDVEHIAENCKDKLKEENILSSPKWSKR